MASVGLASPVPALLDAEEIDPWGAEDDVEHSPSTQALDLQREWEARRLQFHNLGYRDGITAGNNSSVQEGFNVGFKEAVAAGYSWGVARGASSAYAALPVSLKEMVLKDQEAGKRLEELHSTISSISSANAMGMYYNDSILPKRVTAKDSVEGHYLDDSQNKSPVQPLREEEENASQSETGDAASPRCGGGSCGGSLTCSSRQADIDSVLASERKLNGSSPPSASSTALEDSKSNVQITKRAYDFVSSMSHSPANIKHLEDSTNGYLVSLALGDQCPTASTSRAFESSSRLEQYRRNVESELQESVVCLSSFPQ